MKVPKSIADRVKKYDTEQIKLGIKIEKEHDTNDELDVVKSKLDLLKIALAHLDEDPKYYTKLKKMEESLIKEIASNDPKGRKYIKQAMKRIKDSRMPIDGLAMNILKDEIMMAIDFGDGMLEGLVKESPDVIYVGHGDDIKQVLAWNEAQPSFAFNYMKGGNGKERLAISGAKGTHGDINGRENFAGRIWPKKKIISFWSYPPISKLKQVIKDINHTFNNVLMSPYGQTEADFVGVSPSTLEDAKRTMFIRGNKHGKINIDGSWKMDVASEDENHDPWMEKAGLKWDKYSDVAGNSSPIRQSDMGSQKSYLYSLKTIFSNQPLKGIGPQLRKGQKINTDKGQEHVKSIKNKEIQRMSKTQKEKLYNFYKEKGRLSPDEERMYKMINKLRRENYDTHDLFITNRGTIVIKEVKSKKKYFTLEEGTGILTEVYNNE